MTRGLHEIAAAVAAVAVEKLRAAPAGALECEFPDKPRHDGTTEYYWHNSRGRARLSVLHEAIDRVANFAPSLLKLYAPYAPPPNPKTARKAAREADAALKAWAEQWRLDSAPWAIEWARMVLRTLDDREQDKRYAAMTADAPVFAQAGDPKRKAIVGMRFTPAPLDPDDYEWIRSVVPMTVRPFTSPSPKPWQPDVESRTQYRDYICGYKHKNSMGEIVYEPGFLDAVKAMAIAAGMKADPRPLQKHELWHFEFLARCQIGRERVADLAKELPFNSTYPEKAVDKALRALAHDIGLKFRR